MDADRWFESVFQDPHSKSSAARRGHQMHDKIGPLLTRSQEPVDNRGANESSSANDDSLHHGRSPNIRVRRDASHSHNNGLPAPTTGAVRNSSTLGPAVLSQEFSVWRGVRHAWRAQRVVSRNNVPRKSAAADLEGGASGARASCRGWRRSLKHSGDCQLDRVEKCVARSAQARSRLTGLRVCCLGYCDARAGNRPSAAACRVGVLCPPGVHIEVLACTGPVGRSSIETERSDFMTCRSMT